MKDYDWDILEDNLVDKIWDVVYEKYNFNPHNKDVYKLDFKHHVYDISNLKIDWQSNQFNKIIKDIFIKCMKDNKFMYALDWQHSCFSYNPKCLNLRDNPTFINDLSFEQGGYYAHFPSFYPNGDYYLFIDSDFKWGYLTDPWNLKLLVYGKCLMNEIELVSQTLGFVRVN